jgi:hypothetical protein
LFVVALGLAALTACSSGATRPRSAAGYLAIAAPANHDLDTAFDALDHRDRDGLAASQADLRTAVTTERAFDRSLLALDLPGDLKRTANDLAKVNEARARLTEQAAASATLPQLRAYEPKLSAANDAVEQQVRKIRKQLGLPPPDTS